MNAVCFSTLTVSGRSHLHFIVPDGTATIFLEPRVIASFPTVAAYMVPNLHQREENMNMDRDREKLNTLLEVSGFLTFYFLRTLNNRIMYFIQWPLPNDSLNRSRSFWK